MASKVASISAFLIFLMRTQLTSGLKCYQCGALLATEDFGGQKWNLLACELYHWRHGRSELKNKYDPSVLDECQFGERFCMKYTLDDLVVRRCTKTCTEHANRVREIRCCESDACNASFTLNSSNRLLAALTAILLNCMLLKNVL